MPATTGGLLVTAIAYEVVTYKFHAPGTQKQPNIARPIRSIAVLPLENLSGDPSQEYFTDGMTEELITDLAKIGALRVISRTSVMQFKGGRRKPLPEAMRDSRAKYELRSGLGLEFDCGVRRLEAPQSRICFWIHSLRG